LEVLQLRSPLRVKPLRNPGQSISEHLYDRLDKVVLWVMLPTYFLIMAVLEWIRYLWPSDPVPFHLTGIALILVVVSAFKLRKEIQYLKRHRQGRDGEIIVAQYLDSNLGSNATVLHDLPGDGFNVDHVIVCRQGIFVIETKTWSKPDRGNPAITYDGKTIIKDGYSMGDTAIKQVSYTTRYLAE